MHTKILEKCLDELRKDDPRKDYVIGMLETLVDMNTTSAGVVVRPHEDPLPIPEFPVVAAGTGGGTKAEITLTEEELEFQRKMYGPVAHVS